MKIPFIGPAYASDSLPVSAQTCVNWYVEANAPGAEGPVSLKPTPGLVEFADLGTNLPVVGMCVLNEYLFAVSGSTLFKISAAGNASEIGAVLTQAEHVSLAQNGLQLIGADETGGVIYTEAGGLVAITDPDFPNASSLCFFDGYFVYVRPATAIFGVSGLYNGFSYDALQFATAEGAAGNRLLACVNDHRQLWLFGTKSIEIWYNSGSSYFPFTRYGGAFIERGCAARFSPAKVDNSVFWLGDDNVVYRAVDFTPVRISTHALEAAINTYPAVNDSFGYTYSQGGHSFYVLTFPSSGGETWAFDTVTGLWHQRKSYGMTRHRANCYANFNGNHIVGDVENGKLYRMDTETYTDGGDPIVRERTTQVLSSEGAAIRMSSLQVLFEQGTGLLSGQGEDPQAMLQWSDDGARTWSSEMWVSIGKMGKYGYRSIWRRLGSFRTRVFRLRISDPIKAVVIDSMAEIERMR